MCDCQIAVSNQLTLAGLVKRKDEPEMLLTSVLIHQQINSFPNKLILLSPLISEEFRVLVKTNFQIADLPLNFRKCR